MKIRVPNSNWVVALVVTLGIMAMPAKAGMHLEGIHGDLSDTYLAPSSLALDIGSNLLGGSLAGNGSDVDLFSLIVAPGNEISSIRVLEFSGGGAGSFFGLQPGTMLSADPALGSGFPDAIGFALISQSDAAVDRDILSTLTVGPPFLFAETLTAGTYAGWLNETGAASSYLIEFNVVPEPSTMALMAVAAIFLVARRSRRAQR